MAKDVKQSAARRAWLASTSALAGAIIATPAPALALPQGGQVVGGAAVIKQVSPNQITVIEQTPRVVIDWSSFNLGPRDSVVFLNNAGRGSALNEVAGPGASLINGSVSAAGLFALTNPAGIFFGPSAQINVGSLIATTARMSTQDRQNYLASGALSFSTPGNATASVVNQGTLTVAQSGLAALVAPGVQNSGLINARLSKVSLASANAFFVDLYGDRLVNIAVPGSQVTQPPIGQDGKPLPAAVDNPGRIVADGGSVQLTANVARNLVSSVINMSGVVQAQTVAQQGGDIVLDGGQGGVTIAGTIDATGKAAGQQGGTVALAAGTLVHTGNVDASGGAAGGTVAANAGTFVQSGTLRTDGGGTGGRIAITFSDLYVGTQSAALSSEGATRGGNVSVLGGAGSSLLSSAATSVRSSGGIGGEVKLAADGVRLLAASIDASGGAGGGSIAAGSNTAGGANTYVDSGTTLAAAGPAGAAGAINVWGWHGGVAPASIAAASVDPPGPTITLQQLALVDPNANDAFGGAVQVLSNGNIAVAAVKNDAVLLFNGKTGAVISTLMGAGGTFGFSGFGALTNGNFLVLGSSPILVNGTTGLNGIAGGPGAPVITGVSGAALGIGFVNALKASGNPFLVGFANGITPGLTASNNPNSTLLSFGIPPINGTSGLIDFKALPNGNFLLSDGAQTIFGNGATGATQAFATSGTFNAASPPFIFSLAPAAVQTQLTTFCQANPICAISPIGFTKLANGNAVATTALGDTFIGASFNPANTLAQTLTGGGAVTALANGNYVVTTPGALGGAGAVTFGNGTTGIAGAITAGNSLAGAAAGDLNGASVTALSTGNFVVASPNFANGLGAITLGNGTTGITGTIGAGNSVLGTVGGDRIGSGGILAPASGGSFAVLSPAFAGGKGAITVINSASGTQGTLSASNSLIGTSTTDALGSGGGTVLSNGNFVVASPNFGSGIGAATFIKGDGSTVGAVSGANSLLGTATSDHVGSGGVLALATGNYLVMSPSWNGGSGAVTFGSGTTGITGAVSAANSLVGIGAAATIGTPDNANPLVQRDIGVALGAEPQLAPSLPSFGAIPLANGNYVVWSPGSVTFGNGSTGVTGTVTAQNSLTGAGVGDGGLTLLPSGNYLVSSPFATVNGNAFAGAVTFGNGTTGVTGGITAQNSLVGSNPGDLVGFSILSTPTTPSNPAGAKLFQLGIAKGELPFGKLVPADLTAAGIGPGTVVNGAIAVLASGDYVVSSPNASMSAATFGSGTTGVTGIISAQNSVLVAGSQFGTFIQDNPKLGTFVVSGIAFGAVTEVSVTITNPTPTPLPAPTPIPSPQIAANEQVAQPISQAEAITGNMTQPAASLAAAPYAPRRAPPCITVRPDGSCQTETPTSVNAALSAQGNAFLGDLLYRRP